MQSIALKSISLLCIVKLKLRLHLIPCSQCHPVSSLTALTPSSASLSCSAAPHDGLGGMTASDGSFLLVMHSKTLGQERVMACYGPCCLTPRNCTQPAVSSLAWISTADFKILGTESCDWNPANVDVFCVSLSFFNLERYGFHGTQICFLMEKPQNNMSQKLPLQTKHVRELDQSIGVYWCWHMLKRKS